MFSKLGFSLFQFSFCMTTVLMNSSNSFFCVNVFLGIDINPKESMTSSVMDFFENSLSITSTNLPFMKMDRYSRFSEFSFIFGFMILIRDNNLSLAYSIVMSFFLKNIYTNPIFSQNKFSKSSSNQSRKDLKSQNVSHEPFCGLTYKIPS